MSDSHAADVQAELQQYLNSKNINSLFISIVENLLIEKPANPIAFMIEYLNKQFPDQAKEAFDSIMPASAPAAEITTNRANPSPAPAPAPAPSKSPAPASAPADEDSEDDEDDFIADMPEMAVPKAKPKDRRVSVSAESVDPNKLKAQISQVTNIPKSEQVHQSLMKVIAKSPYLRMLDSEQKDLLVKAFSGPIEKKDGEDIIVQGEMGETFYLLDEGNVDIYIKNKGGEGDIKVSALKAGDSFGELAIMYNAPRAATCRVNGSAKVWSLDRLSFKVIVVAAAMQKREKYKGFLEKVPLLQSLTEMEVMTLADSLSEEIYESGSFVCKQGDPGDFFYIVINGQAQCTVVDAAGNSKPVKMVTEGEYFGEIALMTSKPRQATVAAIDGSLKVLAIDRATFNRVFGSMETIMQRNMDVYGKYTMEDAN